MQQQVDILTSLGVSGQDIANGYGVIRVRHSGLSAKVLSYSEEDIIELPDLVLNQANSILNDVVRSTTIPFLQQECAKYIDPTIAFQLLPIKLKNLKFHAFSLYLEGDIINEMKNKGKDGKKGTTTRWFWESCPSDDGEYDWSTVTGSADISTNFSHDIIETETDKLLDEISESISVARSKTVSASAHWKTEGLGDLIRQIVNLLLSGGITTENGYEVKVTYSFNGSKTITKKINAKVWLPLDGDVTWVWD